MARVTEWRKLPVSLAELCVDTTLRCGQQFRWRKSGEDGEWTCAIGGRILSLRQDPTHLHYRAIFPRPTDLPLTPPSSAAPSTIDEEDDDTPAFLHHYFNLEPDLTQLYEQWSTADPNFKRKAPKFTGVRILRQDAWEALVGFICSSNNNIARISQMMEKLCTNYGPLLGHHNKQPYHALPPPSALTGPGVEAQLRGLGFGYRAKYIHQTAILVTEREKEFLGNSKISNGTTWLDSLRNPESPAFGAKPSYAGELGKGRDGGLEGRDGYKHAHEQLLELQGVGPKVADCVCLMGLGWGEAVPVDTHVHQIAMRDYRFKSSKLKTLNKATYDAIGDHFRALWGKQAGWAHSVLFTADLRVFAERLNAKVKVKESDVKVEIEEDVKVESDELGNVKMEEKFDSVLSGTTTKGKRVLQVEESARAIRAKRRRWS